MCMKYLHFISILIFFFCYRTVNGQLVVKPAVGINFTDFSKKPSSGEYKSQVGWQIGGTVAIGKKVYIEPGAFYLQKSTEYESDTSSNINFDISGIRIPLAVGVNLLGDDKTVFNLHVFGGASAFLLTSVKDLDKDDFKKACFGLFAGAGVDISIIFVDLQYEWSLTEVSDIETAEVGKYRSFFINAGVRIPLK
jgi:hypothetical protein